ncbi:MULTISPECIES: DcrB-related protein [Serratia]|uniref:DcrB-related protein n=1 Tax=Serratia TaxID=613 RepID=UPI000D958758|nr:MULTISPECIES: DcrB-related protein [Serratia]MCS4266243.1 hypothetical protein [Serratia sp. BIGb0163]CAI1095735.1 Uncharacterized conserved protein [Serratia quinivorans]CAI1928481.1 Uncharacterized conserved protein [Serratia quinivorans]SPZ63733.1 Uncharacterized conserved protein [Serratia quinivorans]VEI71515.1 Uncharacterized conserved protein [Serratia quinivorans]
MNYLFQEGHFTLPAGPWQDCTVNILKNPQTGASLVITRGAIPQDSTLEDEFEKQWQALLPQITDLQQSPRQRISVGPNHLIRAIEVTSNFIRAGHHHHQHQLAAQPEGSQTLLIVTYSSMKPFTREDDHEWQQVKASLALTGQDDR